MTQGYFVQAALVANEQEMQCHVARKCSISWPTDNKRHRFLRMSNTRLHVVKDIFEHKNARYRVLAKINAQLNMLFALSNLYMMPDLHLFRKILMYLPKHYEETDVDVLHALIRAHPLGAWVAHSNGELRVNHIPFLVDQSRGARGVLVGHVARSNDVYKLFAEPVNCVVIFQGSEGYITPSWYPSKHASGKVVPTWNYAVVHVHGQPCVIEDRDWLLEHINQFTDTYEARQVHPWKVSDAPCDYIERQISAIVGIEIPIDKLVGKWKVSQNRTLSDKLGVIAGLLGCNNARLKEMAALVGEHGDLGNHQLL